MFLGEVLESVVVEVASEPDSPQYKDRPVGHSWATLIGTGGPVDILSDGIEQRIPELGTAVDVLQGSEDGDDLIAAVGVESNIRNDRAIEPELGIEGCAHRSAPRRFHDLSPGNGGFLKKSFKKLTIFEEHPCGKSGENKLQNTFSDGH
jgi:hypothetical protein